MEIPVNSVKVYTMTVFSVINNDNALILVALGKETSLHPPSKFLLRALAITDLCVGVIAEPLLITGLMSMV